MATPEKCVYVFTSRLGCKKGVSSPEKDGEASSMLPCFLENESSTCTLPSLHLRKDACLKSSSSEETIKELKSSLEARKGTISFVPTAILQNVTRSFGNMIDNRIKQVHLCMLANADEKNKEQDVNLKLASLLCSEKNCPTVFTSAESSFRPLPLSKGHIKHVGRIKAVILPLVFKTTITINILGTKERKVTLVAPGTIVGTFHGSCTRLRTAELTLDTSAMYSSMKERCDGVVAFTFETASRMLRDSPPPSTVIGAAAVKQEPNASRPSTCRVKSPSEASITYSQQHPVSP